MAACASLGCALTLPGDFDGSCNTGSVSAIFFLLLFFLKYQPPKQRSKRAVTAATEAITITIESSPAGLNSQVGVDMDGSKTSLPQQFRSRYVYLFKRDARAAGGGTTGKVVVNERV